MRWSCWIIFKVAISSILVASHGVSRVNGMCVGVLSVYLPINQSMRSRDTLSRLKTKTGSHFWRNTCKQWIHKRLYSLPVEEGKGKRRRNPPWETPKSSSNHLLLLFFFFFEARVASDSGSCRRDITATQYNWVVREAKERHTYTIHRKPAAYLRGMTSSTKAERDLNHWPGSCSSSQTRERQRHTSQIIW